METSSLLFSSRETASPGWRTSKKKRLDAAAEASLQPRTACPGTKIAPRRSVCQHPASMARPAGKKRPPGCGQSGPAGGPASQGRWQSLDLSVLPLAADMATAVGHGRFGSAKGALGGSAGTALASGAYRMAVATDIAANITFVDRSRKTAGGTHRHGLPHRVGVTLSGSECLILLRDRSRSRDLWKTFPDFSLFHLYY